LALTALLVSAYVDWNTADPAGGSVLDHLYRWRGLGAVISPVAVTVSTSLLFVAMVAGLIGMFLLKRWGRTLCLVAMFTSPLLYAISGLYFFTAPVGALGGISTAFQILILGMALFDPEMRALFEGGSSTAQPPNNSLERSRDR
jgi:hypothetical protein